MKIREILETVDTSATKELMKNNIPPKKKQAKAEIEKMVREIPKDK
jgi:hypothetical protein